MLKHLSLFVVLSTVSAAAMAETLKTEAELLPLTESIMSKVGKGDLPGAFEIMKPYTVIPSTEFDAAVLTSKSQRDQVGTRYGLTIGYECLKQQKVGESLVKITCIEKTEKHALPWLFYYYKAPTGWALNSFFWNDKLSSLFPEAG